MGMDLEFKPQGGEETEEVQATKQEQAPEQEQTYDVVVQRRVLTQELADSAEVSAIMDTIDINNQQSIVKFGGKAAEEIAKCSDKVLSSMSMDKINDTGKLLKALGVIMDKFDINEVSSEGKGFLQKIFGSVQKQLDQLLAKYNTMGDEVDKIYIQLKEYEAEIGGANGKLQEIFQANINYYSELVKYILAGEKALELIDVKLTELRDNYAKNPDNMLHMEINNLEQARIILEQRVQDLRVAENVAMQSIPMIQAMRFGNLNLIRKINSAFIITLPVFKQALTQAILLKRQKIQAEAMQALDERTNEMLLKNAQNTVDQTKLTARMAGSSSVKVETLEQTWRTIVNGIEETRRIQEEASAKRAADAQKLAALKEDYFTRMG
ncbi:MAG: toxic anion resistance protein [Gracilibacteraceae bacterium]|jgi:uncharacterized protein YaaN involved in tellurite resistance|nr:toxic anion resistance protein [Gracilibacteraceae bacterium]